MRFSLFVSLAFVFGCVAALDFNLARDFFHLKRADNTATNTQTTTTLSLSQSDTTVWVTITTNGALATVKSIWSQNFMSTFTTDTATPSSGNVGMGTISGSVGGVRSYDQTTISNGANKNLMYGGAAGAFMVVFGLL